MLPLTKPWHFPALLLMLVYLPLPLQAGGPHAFSDRLTVNRSADEPEPGEERKFEIAPGTPMVFCWIPAGKATLGMPDGRKDMFGDETEHKYATKGFWLGKYEVTQTEWTAVMGKNPSLFSATGGSKDKVKGLDTSRFPVDAVSWLDAGKMMDKLNVRGGGDKAFGRPGKFVLPTADEFEFACRGGKGNSQPFYWGKSLNGTEANCNGTMPYGTTKKGPDLQRPTFVGSYAEIAPHSWGLCDIVGNVPEWCAELDDVKDSFGNKYAAYHAGSWQFGATSCRSGSRSKHPHDREYNLYCGIGVRVCYRPQ